MFRSIVSRLSFSPALVGQLSFYAKRLKKEQVTRRLGLIFTAFALVVQSLVVFQAPEPANAASYNDFVYGGVRNTSHFLGVYDKNTANIRDMMNAFGITRDEIAATRYEVITVGTKVSWGRHARAIDTGSRKVNDSAGNYIMTVYGRPMSKQYKRGEISRAEALVGYSKSQGWFGIILNCGNLVLDKIPPLPPEPKDISVCRLSDKKTITIKENLFNPKLHSKAQADCVILPPPANLVLSKKASNVTQGNINAISKVAHASDRITYTLEIKNTGGTAAEATFVDNIGDALEYGKLVDNGGGMYEEKEKNLAWAPVVIEPGTSERRTYSIQLASTLPSTPRGISDRTSHDCLIDNVFGNATQIKVSCEAPKVVEEVIEELPKTGPTENMIFAAALMAVVTYFYFRSKQLNKEVRYIRRDLNAGTL